MALENIDDLPEEVTEGNYGHILDTNNIIQGVKSLRGSQFIINRKDALPSFYSYFGNKSDQYSPWAKVDSGHQISFHGNGAPVIVGGTFTTLGSGVRASYLRTPQFSSTVTRIGARFRLLPGTGTRTDGGTACIAISQNLINVSSGVNTNMSCHFFSTSKMWAYTLWTQGVGQVVLATGNYATPLLTDYFTEYEMEVWINGTTATFQLPDGSRQSVTDNRINTYAGRYAYFEPFLPNGDTDDIAAFTHIWADTGIVRIPDRKIYGTLDAVNIADASATGRNILKASSITDVRNFIGAAPTSHTHTIDNITAGGTASSTTYLRGDGTWATPAGGGGDGASAADDILDASTIGKNVLRAADAPTIRSIIGAGTSSLTIGTTNTTAKAGDYQPTVANISNATTIGRNLLLAADAAAIRTLTGAGTSNLTIGTTSTTAKAGDYVPTKADVGLSNVDNTSDVNKPVSTATAAAINAKIQVVSSLPGTPTTGVLYVIPE